MTLCRCGFDARGGHHHFEKHVAFYRNVPGQDGKHGVPKAQNQSPPRVTP